MATFLDVQQFETYVSACAANSGVVVQWDNADATPRTDGKKMWLPAITSSTSDEWMKRMRYFVKHETSHIVYSDFGYLNEKKPSGLLALINNLIEDHRIDYRNDMEYRGDAVISNNFWELFADDVSKRVDSEDAELSEQQMLTLPLFIWDAAMRDWISSAHETKYQLAKHLDDDGVTRLEKLEKYTLELIRVRESGEAEDVLSLAEVILRDLYEQDPEEYKNKVEVKVEGGTEGSGSAGDDGGEVVADDVDRLITVDKLIKAIGHEHKPSRTGIHMVMGDEKGKKYSIPNPKDYVICTFDKPLPSDIAAMLYTGYFARGLVNSYITNNARPMANKLRLRLQTRSRDRYEYGKKKGKLHNGSLHRVVSGDSKLAERVFRTKVISNTTDTAVCLLVDCSGSMSGKKFDMACAGAGAVSQALRPLNIAHCIYGFTNTPDSIENPLVWVFNEYGESVSQAELINRFDKVSGGLWQNSDGDGIAYAMHKLLNRKEHRKVLLVLSDGSPAGRDHAGDIAGYTKDVIKLAEKSGIDVYGIGIQDENVRRFYTKNEVVYDLSKLAPTILSIIDRSI